MEAAGAVEVAFRRIVVGSFYRLFGTPRAASIHEDSPEPTYDTDASGEQIRHTKAAGELD